MGNIWIGPWANFPHYMDPTLAPPGMTHVLPPGIGISPADRKSFFLSMCMDPIHVSGMSERVFFPRKTVPRLMSRFGQSSQ